ncbi:HNH endonuclease [bacterium]|nr:HNH endonuclease [bacterium]
MDCVKMNKKELLEGVKSWVKKEKEATLAVLEFLSEINRRAIWQEEGYSSLKDFCVRFLGYSEGEAGRRIHAANCVEEVPEIKPFIQESRLSLSAVSLIAPHISSENAPKMLPLVEGKPTSEISMVLFEHFDVPLPKEGLKLPYDAELEELLKEAEGLLSEKDKLVLVKQGLKSLIKQKRACWDEPKRKVKTSPKKHTRYIPLATRREVKRQSDGCCEFRSASGVRCNQTAHLQFDHVRAWAHGGSSREIGNIRLLCKVHNLFLARGSFAKARGFGASEISREISGHGA